MKYIPLGACATLLSTLLYVPLSVADPTGIANDPGQAPKPADNLVWVALPRDLPEGPNRLQTVLWTDDRLLAEESLDLAIPRRPIAGQSREAEPRIEAVELLGFQPRLRERVLALAADPAQRVDATMTLNGEVWKTVSLAELRTASARLQRVGFRPLDARPEVVTPERVPKRARLDHGFAAAQSPACVQQCGQAQLACESDCVPETFECLDYCSGEYDGCVAACPATCTGPTVRDYNELTPVSFTYLGPTRCYDHPLTHRILWDRGRLQQKITRYRETTQCNGTVTTVVLSTHFPAPLTCWAKGVPIRSCSPAAGSALNILVCPGSF